ncbi:hypothetical protein DNTS_031314 [Danionella cerebrum]|uniref:FYVE-type domain-containing protein n=1 Tax=Danionella cerebrum TaxID=2873325 RepID=A0A553PVM5_9TELE|nr:hypothetical protein DNTS_031314 [Danionella translucida]
MEVQEIVKHNALHTFTIIGKHRSLELQARTAEEKQDWIKVILDTVEKDKEKSESFRGFNGSFSREEEHPSETQVQGSGTLVNTSETDGAQSERKSLKKREKEREMCKTCSETFNFTRRKHHCKSCGALVCGKCVSRNTRVCKPCAEAEGGATENNRRLERLGKSEEYDQEQNV